MDFKKAGYKLLTYVPGVGLVAYGIKEYKTRKNKSPWYDIRKSGDRKALGIYGLEIGWFALAISWKLWLGNGIATGEWNPLKYFDSKQKTEQVEKIPKREKNNLENKTLNYYELSK
jgi:hypothetical protein